MNMYTAIESFCECMSVHNMFFLRYVFACFQQLAMLTIELVLNRCDNKLIYMLWNLEKL